MPGSVGQSVVRGIAAAVVAVCLAMPAAAGAASSAPLVIEHVDTSRFPTVRVTVHADRLSALQQLSVVENGQRIGDVTLPSINSTSAIALAVDTSRSMQGKRLSDVIAAGSEFVRLKRSTDAVGVYGFAAAPYQLAPFSTERASALGALHQAASTGPVGTATYAAVTMIAHAVAKVPAVSRSLVLVTDGQSLRDPATISQAIKAATAAHLSIYPVVILTPVADVKSLQQLAAATGGSVVTAANSGQLTRVYRDLSRQLSSTYTFSYASRGSWTHPNSLLISAPGLGKATATVRAPAGVTPPQPSVKAPTSMTGQVVLVVGMMILLGILAIGSLKLLEVVRR